MRSHLLCCGLLALLADLAAGQWGGGFYFPDEDDSNSPPFYGQGWPRPPPRPNGFQRPSSSPNGPARPRPPSPTRNTPGNDRNDPNTRSLPLEDCGTTQAIRILGGQVASPGQYPWSALLQYKNGRGRLSFECGGALINKRYVLTAAHCLHKRIIRDFSVVSVRLGEHDTSRNEDCVENPDTGESECADAPQDFGVERQIMHPQYRGEPESKFDIGLIRLTRDVPTTDFIRPVCLPIEESARSAGNNLIVSGWGITESGQKSSKLLFVALPHVDINTCSTQLNKNLDSSQLCAGGQRGKDSCQGDSGGPLIEAGSINNDKRFIIKGLVSFGPRQCGTENKPGVYTRVSAYTDWIIRTINS